MLMEKIVIIEFLSHEQRGTASDFAVFPILEASETKDFRGK